jgi:[ribosomal protein S5]-alanine N-acetyltransferase
MWIETQRLVLREFQREDFQELVSILADPQIIKLSSTGILSILQMQERIKSFISSYNEFGFGK